MSATTEETLTNHTIEIKLLSVALFGQNAQDPTGIVKEIKEVKDKLDRLYVCMLSGSLVIVATIMGAILSHSL